MFWIEKEKIMLTGNHVLFDITAWKTIWRTFAGQTDALVTGSAGSDPQIMKPS
jgi:hypothetical protein